MPCWGREHTDCTERHFVIPAHALLAPYAITLQENTLVGIRSSCIIGESKSKGLCGSSTWHPDQHKILSRFSKDDWLVKGVTRVIIRKAGNIRPQGLIYSARFRGALCLCHAVFIDFGVRVALWTPSSTVQRKWTEVLWVLKRNAHLGMAAKFRTKESPLLEEQPKLYQAEMDLAGP